MDCKTAENLISAMHEGQLSSKLRVELSKHLSICPSCAALEKNLEQLHERLGELFESNRLPADFSDRVIASVESRSLPVTSRKTITPAWFAIAAIILLGITLIFIGSIIAPSAPTVKNPNMASSKEVGEKNENSQKGDEESESLASDSAKREEIAPVRRPLSINRKERIAREDANRKYSKETKPAEQLANKPESLKPAEPERDGGHGKSSAIESELMASPLGEPIPQAPENANEQPKRPALIRPRPQAKSGDHRLPAERERLRPGAGGEPTEEERRKLREHLAEKTRKESEAALSGLEPEERGKVTSAIKVAAEKNIPGVLAVKTARIVLASGATAEEAAKAVSALVEANEKGVPPRRFVAVLERALERAPKGANMERLINRVVESLKNNENPGAGRQVPEGRKPSVQPENGRQRPEGQRRPQRPGENGRPGSERKKRTSERKEMAYEVDGGIDYRFMCNICRS